MKAITTLFTELRESEKQYTEGLITQSECITVILNVTVNSIKSVVSELAKQQDNINSELAGLPEIAKLPRLDD